MIGARAEWDEALRRAEARDLAPPEVIAQAREALAVRAEGDLTPDLLAFWLDAPASELEALLREVRAEAPAPAREAAPVEPLTLPATLGPFELLERLGQGGMGTVYRARERTLGRDVALKLLSPRLAADPEARRRFVREGQALARVNHPNVITCYTAGELDGRPFIGMELMQGGDVQGLLVSSPGGLPERRALALVRDAARGLAALEAAGLVHRDVKPTNLLLGPEGEVKLGDLGLARRRSGADRVTLTGLAVGTPGFMAPEQLEGAADVDVRADVYGLGATLLALLSGRAPDPGPGALAGLEARCPGASPAALALVRRAMDPDPARRFASARALEAAIEAAIDGSTDEPAPAPSARSPRRPSRLPWVVGAALIAAAGLGGALGGGGAGPVTPRAATPATTPSDPGERATRPTFDITPSDGGTTRRADGVYVSSPGPTAAWQRAGLFDRERRALPLHVRWTCAAVGLRDASGLADWERAHGFTAPAAFFHELGLRAAGHPIDAARQLEPGAWWVTLQARADGRVLGLVRVLNRDKPPGADLAVGRTPGVAIVDRFEVAPGEPLVLDLRADARGWTLEVQQADRVVAASSRGWADVPGAPITDELREGAFLWTHLGNWSDGHGTGTVAVELVE